MAPDQEIETSNLIDELQDAHPPDVCDMSIDKFIHLNIDTMPTEMHNKVNHIENEELAKDLKKVDRNFSSDGIPKPNIQLSSPDDVRLEWLKVQKVGAGLVNLGNSCFLNTVVQCLTYCPPLANYLLQEDHTASCTNYEFCMMCELAKHMKQAFQRSGDVIKPLCIYQNLKYIADHFQVGRQEDAHECLRFVIENLWRASLYCYGEERFDPAIRETTIINHIFGGYSRSQVICLKCKKSSEKYEHFMDFILDIKHNSHTLEKALEHFVKPEILENENAYSCPSCKTLVQAEKTLTIHRAPNVATIQLKRFDYNHSCGGKITKHISYPEKLNLRPYMSQIKDYPLIYKLNAVLVHAGPSCNSGHYYCYIKNSNERWYLMDDTKVQRVSLHDVLNQQAYVLFYIRLPTPNKAHFKENNHIPVINEKNSSKSFGFRYKDKGLHNPRRPSFFNLPKHLKNKTLKEYSAKKELTANNSLLSSSTMHKKRRESEFISTHNRIKPKTSNLKCKNNSNKYYVDHRNFSNDRSILYRDNSSTYNFHMKKYNKSNTIRENHISDSCALDMMHNQQYENNEKILSMKSDSSSGYVSLSSESNASTSNDYIYKQAHQINNSANHQKNIKNRHHYKYNSHNFKHNLTHFETHPSYKYRSKKFIDQNIEVKRYKNNQTNYQKFQPYNKFIPNHPTNMPYRDKYPEYSLKAKKFHSWNPGKVDNIWNGNHIKMYETQNCYHDYESRQYYGEREMWNGIKHNFYSHKRYNFENFYEKNNSHFKRNFSKTNWITNHNKYL